MNPTSPSPAGLAVSKADIVRALTPFATPDTRKGVLLFCADYAVYWAALAVVLLCPWFAAKLAASLVAGLKLTALLTLGHDAAHRSLVRGRGLNKAFALACFVPCLHNYRLWVWDHLLHHQHSNGGHFDSYTPYSKQEYDRLSPGKRLFERVIRSPNLIGFGIHYLFQRMPRVRVYPTPAVPRQLRHSAWLHTGLLAVYHTGFLALLCVAPAVGSVSLGEAIVLGYLLPMAVFGTITGGALYLMHTHRRVPWFRGDRPAGQGALAELCATNLTMPPMLASLMHNVFLHSAHHAHPAVPSYRMAAAQARLDELLGTRAVAEPMKLGAILATMRACKLFDYDNLRWLDFDGRPTTLPIDLGPTSSNGARRYA